MKNVKKNLSSAIAVFGGGCFWCTEAVFKMLKGVQSVVPGYAGGDVRDPSYETISTGKTGHAEVVRIQYDPVLVTYRDLLTVFFATHDPFSKNRQGADVGTQYRSLVLYTSDTQRSEAERFVAELVPGAVTDIKPLESFYEAEDYHHDYYAKNKTAPYCVAVIDPKLAKVRKEFSRLIKS